MRIVLLGDMHVFTLGVSPWQLLSKRFFGQMNLWFNRRWRFDLQRFPALVEHARSLEPDWFIGSGDLTTTALPHEFELAKRFLKPLSDGVDTFMVPGNHDRYTMSSKRFRTFEAHLNGMTAKDWPHHRQIGDRLHVVGIDPTRPTMFTAAGMTGRDQLDKLAAMFTEIDRSHRVIVVCHYPPGTPPERPTEAATHRLADQAALVKVLAEAGHEMLYLHGHIHRPWVWRMTEDVAPNVVALNAGAPVMKTSRHPAGQGFWQIDVDTAAPEAHNEASGGWLSFVHHSADEAGNWRSTDVAFPKNPGDSSPIEHG